MVGISYVEKSGCQFSHGQVSYPCVKRGEDETKKKKKNK